MHNENNIFNVCVYLFGIQYFHLSTNVVGALTFRES